MDKISQNTIPLKQQGQKQECISKKPSRKEKRLQRAIEFNKKKAQTTKLQSEQQQSGADETIHLLQFEIIQKDFELDQATQVVALIYGLMYQMYGGFSQEYLDQYNYYAETNGLPPIDSFLG